MSLSTAEESLAEMVFNMDPSDVVALTGCHPSIAERVPFRAWMWLVVQLIQSGPIVLSRYETAGDVILGYAREAGLVHGPRYLARGA